MNSFDYFFENTSSLEKNFLLGPKETVSYRDLFNRCVKLAQYLNKKVGEAQNILLLSPNSLFFITAYLAILKSGNVAVPLNPETEQSNLDFIVGKCQPKLVFSTKLISNRLIFKGVEIIDETLLSETLETLKLTETPETLKSSETTETPETLKPSENLKLPETPETLKPFETSETPSSNSPTPPPHSSSLQPSASSPTPTPTPHPHSSSLQPTAYNLASIIFTSGSTGEPKGVMISHKNLIANTGSIVEYLKLSQEDTMLVVLPFYYCYGLSLLHTHLRAGGSIVLNNMFIMLGGVINDLKKYRCTGFAGVPTHFQVLLRKSDSFKTMQFPDLKYVTQAGGKLHNSFITEFLETFPDISFNVMYGQTEATARLTWLPPEKLPAKIGSCGKAIPGVTIKIVDENGKAVKKGVPGEILAYGDNIMEGYYLDQASTQATLKEGWLHTGDLATMDEDGFLYLTARKKEIIKVGGRRVSPKEVEEVIVSIPEVVDCVIETVYDEILGETMKALIVVKVYDETKITSDVIKSWCTSRLASYKIPQYIEIKDKMTISATGKKPKK